MDVSKAYGEDMLCARLFRNLVSKWSKEKDKHSKSIFNAMIGDAASGVVESGQVAPIARLLGTTPKNLKPYLVDNDYVHLQHCL